MLRLHIALCHVQLLHDMTIHACSASMEHTRFLKAYNKKERIYSSRTSSCTVLQQTVDVALQAWAACMKSSVADKKGKT